MDIDLKLWMTNLDLCTRRIPIIYLAIPGTHDSMTFSINNSSSVSPDCTNLVRFFLKFGSFVKRIVVGWSVTQTLAVKDQLYNGIRYFDLRIAKKDEDDKFYYVHSLFGSEIESKLKEISTFLEENEKEVVILDFQHFYNLQKHDHISLIELINRIFGSKICPDPCNIQSVTLDWMEENLHQVVIIYRDNMCCIDERFWPSYKFPTPWPNTTNIGYLSSFLRDGLKHRKPNQGYVSQCVLTPDDIFVILHIYGNLKRCCAEPCLQAVLPWIDSQHAGDHTGINVIISDFIEQNNSTFCTSVVKLNYKIFLPKSPE